MLTRRKNRQGCLRRVIFLGVIAGVLFVVYDQILMPTGIEAPPLPTATPFIIDVTPTLTLTAAPSPTPLPLIGEPTLDPSQ